MLSGIGPADHLREHGIDVSIDLPGVGQNLHDHPLISIKYECTKPVTPHNLTNPFVKLWTGFVHSYFKLGFNPVKGHRMI